MTEHESDSSSSDSQTTGHGDGVVIAEYESFSDLLNQCASKVSEEGLIVETDSAVGLGSTMRFELRIRDGFAVLVGAGEVVRAREIEEGQPRRVELALRFLHLDQPSLKLLPRLIEHYRKRGVTLLELPPGEFTVPSGETASVSQDPPSLTLRDLEEEFSDQDRPAAQGESGAEPEPRISADGASGELLVDADEMVEVGEQGAEIPVEVDGEAVIHVEDLMPAGGAEVGSDVLATQPELEGPPEDPGLPWLPDEIDSKKRGDLWLILLLAILGALLGAGFYYLYLHGSDSSRGESQTLESTQVVSAHRATLRDREQPAESLLLAFLRG